jgi:hypothetical protein
MTDPNFPEWSKITTGDQQHAFIRQLAVSTWQHPFLNTLELDNFRPIYRVPGRRRNGSVTGQHRVRWLFGRILLPLRDVALSLVWLLSTEVKVSYRTNIVAGPADCSALRFADANSAEQQNVDIEPLWYAWSPNQAVLFKVVDKAPTRLLEMWSSGDERVPEVDPVARTLRWQDGSTITFEEKSWSAPR